MPRPFLLRASAALLVLCAAAASVALATSAASAAGLPTPTTNKSLLVAGEPFQISGTGCREDSEPAHLISVSVSGTQVVGKTGPAMWSDGAWSLAVSVMNPPPGPLTLSATCHFSTGSVAYPPVTVTIVDPSQYHRTPTPAPPPVSVPAAPSNTRTRTTASPSPEPEAPVTLPVPAQTPMASIIPAPDCSDCAQLGADGAVQPGAALALRYAGFQPGKEVTIVMHSTPVTLGTFTADASGLVTAEVTIPAAAEPGSHTLTVSAPGTPDLVVGFRVVASQERAAPRESVTAANPKQAEGAFLAILAGTALLVMLGAGCLVVLIRQVRARRPRGSDLDVRRDRRGWFGSRQAPGQTQDVPHGSP